MRKIFHELFEKLVDEIRKIVKAELTTFFNTLLEHGLVRYEENDEERANRERAILAQLPPIANQTAAALVRRSTRQLQRKRAFWKLEWIEEGSETKYAVLPLIDAIRRHNLQWDAKVFEEIRNSAKNFPRL